jgi:hypothetical protein
MTNDDFKRKAGLRGLRMNTGGLVEERVPLHNISLRTAGEGPRRLSDVVDKARAPSEPTLGTPAPAVPETPPAQRPRILKMMSIGVRGATGGETGNLVKEAKKRLGLRQGGLVRGPGGPEDDEVNGVIVAPSGKKQPVSLSDKEYVLPAKTTAAIGVENLDQLVMETNDGKAPAGAREGLRMAGGGIIGDVWETAKRKYENFRSGVRQVPPVEPAPAAPASGSAFSGPGRPLPMNPAPSTIYVDSGGRAAPGELFEDASRRQYTAKQNAQPGFNEPAPAPKSGVVSRGLRAVGRFAAPVAAGTAAIEAATTTSDEAAANVEARTGLRASTIERAMNNPIFRTAAMGPAGLLMDGKAATDVATGVGSAALSTVGLGPERGARAGPVVPASESANAATGTTLRGSIVAPPAQPAMPSGSERGADGTYENFIEVNGKKIHLGYSTAAERAKGDTTEKLGERIEIVGKGIGRYSQNGREVVFPDGSRQPLGQPDYARIKLRQEIEQRDATLQHTRQQTATSKAVGDAAGTRAQTDAAELRRKNEEAALKTYTDATDRLFKRTVKDKDGQERVIDDPEGRNRFEAVARRQTKGAWDKWSPEQRLQALSPIEDAYRLSELINKGESTLLGRIITGVGVRSAVQDAPTQEGLAVKDIRPLSRGDVGRTNQVSNWDALSPVLSGSPYVEFANGKLVRLSEVFASPELMQGFERRLLADSNKAVLQKYLEMKKKHLGEAK